MKQVYIQSYFKSGHGRFMKYVHDVLDYPKWESIEQRLKIIKFFDDYGASACKRAFGKSRSTVYLWKQRLREASGKLSALAPGDRSPTNKRHRVIDPFIERFIVEYRSEIRGLNAGSQVYTKSHGGVVCHISGAQV